MRSSERERERGETVEEVRKEAGVKARHKKESLEKQKNINNHYGVYVFKISSKKSFTHHQQQRVRNNN